MHKNMVGLEAEFILRDAEGEVVFPSEHWFDTDGLCLLGEFRGLPGKSPSETIGNFLTSYFEVLAKAERKNLTVDLSGHTQVSPEMYAEALRKVGTKEVAQCTNIYGTDILTLSDQVVRKGKMVGVNISSGLHIHFSSEDRVSREITSDKYIPVDIPLTTQGIETILHLYRADYHEAVSTIEAVVSRITKPVITHFVNRLDDEILAKYKSPAKLKYRQPGWYEVKPWGFEYRSLPFNTQTHQDLLSIVAFAFNLFNDL